MKTTQVWLCATALLVPGLAGCGGSSSSSATTTPPLTPRTVSAALPNGLTATLTEDRIAVAVGGTVNYTVTLTNNTAQPISYQPLYGGYSAPPLPAVLVVSNSSHQTVYPLGVTTNLDYVGQTVTLTPGQSMTEIQAVSTNANNGLTVSGGYFAAGSYTAAVSFNFSSSSQQPGGTVGPLSVTAQ